MPGSLDSIVSLQKVLNELSDAKGRLEGIPDWMQELHSEHSSRQAEITALAETAETSASERRAAEAQHEDAQEKLKHFQQQIGKVSTQREYAAVLKEIDAVKDLSSELEQQALTALESFEQARKSLEELQEAFRDLDERYQTELAKWESEKPKVATRVVKLERQAKTLRAEIPQGVSRMFDRLYERYSGEALARVLKVGTGQGSNAVNHCSACNYRIRPQLVVEIRDRGLLNQCDNCKRILYYEAEAAEV